jgi:hypothetical protein
MFEDVGDGGGHFLAVWGEVDGKVQFPGGFIHQGDFLEECTQRGVKAFGGVEEQSALAGL